MKLLVSVAVAAAASPRLEEEHKTPLRGFSQWDSLLPLARPALNARTHINVATRGR